MRLEGRRRVRHWHNSFKSGLHLSTSINGNPIYIETNVTDHHTPKSVLFSANRLHFHLGCNRRGGDTK